MADMRLVYPWARVTPKDANAALWIAYTGKAFDAAHDDVLAVNTLWDEAWDALMAASMPVGSLPSGSWTTLMRAAYEEKVGAYMSLSDDALMAVLALMRHDKPLEFWIATCAFIFKQAKGGKHEAP